MVEPTEAERGRNAIEQDIARGIRHPKKRAFLIALSTSGNITAAARAAGVGRASHYVWMDDDPAYARAVERAKQISADLLEAALRQRGMGWNEAVYHQGVQIGEVRRYDTTAAIFLLKGLRPEIYDRPRGFEVTGPAGGPVQLEHRLADLSERLRQAAELEAGRVIDTEAREA